MKRIHRGFLCFVLLLASLSSFAQERYPIRVYQIGTKVFTADSAGTTVFTYSTASASVDAIGPLIQLTTDKKVRSYTPAKFLNSSGAPWGATVSDAVSAYQASTAQSSGGGGSGGSFSGNAADIVSGTLNVARLPASVLLSTGSYSNPAWLTALSPDKVPQTSLYRFTTDAEKTTWNAKQNALTLTTTGSGAATFNQSTGALNIPTPSAGGSGSTDSTQFATRAYVNPKFAATSTSSVVITSGSTATLSGAPGPIWVKVRPTSTLASLAITTPAALVDNQRIMISFGGGSGNVNSGVVVTSFSLVANSGQTILQATVPASMRAGETIEYRYDQSISTIIRIY